MSGNTNKDQAARLVRTRQSIRTDLWPDAPQIPQKMVDRFPELQQFNEDMKRFVELVRESTESAVPSQTGVEPS